jgi:hypothetical protein
MGEGSEHVEFAIEDFNPRKNNLEGVTVYHSEVNNDNIQSKILAKEMLPSEYKERIKNYL